MERGSRSAGDLDSAVRALIGRVAREATPREAREDQAGAGVIVCVHDNPASGELSLVGDSRDGAVLAIRRTCHGSMRAGLIATAERLERREGCRGDERQTTSAGSSRSDRSCSTSTARRPMIDQEHPARRPGHRADLRAGERIGGSKRGVVMCRDHEAPPVARGEAPVAAGVVEPTERTPPSTGCHRRGRDACPHEPGLPLPPARTVRPADRRPNLSRSCGPGPRAVGWLRIDRGEACVLVGWAAIGAGRGVGVMDERAQGLLDVAAGVLGELDLEVVIDRLLESARELTGAQYAALGVLDASRTELERFIAVGIDETVRREIGALPHGKGVLGELIRDPFRCACQPSASTPAHTAFRSGTRQCGRSWVSPSWSGRSRSGACI